MCIRDSLNISRKAVGRIFYHRKLYGQIFNLAEGLGSQVDGFFGCTERIRRSIISRYIFYMGDLSSHNTCLLYTSMQITLWEISWYLRSMEELFCDMMEGSDMAEFMFDKALEMAKVRAESYVKAGVDALLSLIHI